jgi:hypothetical protein
MYRLNFYRESAFLSAASRRRVLQLGLGVALLGTAVLLVGLLMVSVRQLQDRAAQVRAATERLQARAQGVAATTETDLELAWSILKVRQERVDWAPQLAAVAETIGPELVLVGLKGQGPGARQAVALEMTGRFSRGEAQLDAVTGFVENLRRDERIAGALPVCRLGEVREGAQSGFTITCQRAAEQTP